MPTDFDKRLCCAAGICCGDGSEEQFQALVSLLEEGEEGGSEDVDYQKTARTVLRLFKLSDRSGRTKPEDFAA